MTEIAKRILERLRFTTDELAWHDAKALAKYLNEPEERVRAALAGLSARDYVRGRDFGTGGPRYEITAQGRRALAAA